MLKKIHDAMTAPLMIVYPTSPCGQAIARLESPYHMKLALCRTDPQKMTTPMPHLHAADAPFRMAWLWRGADEAQVCVKEWENWQQLAPAQRVAKIPENRNAKLLIIVFGAAEPVEE